MLRHKISGPSYHAAPSPLPWKQAKNILNLLQIIHRTKYYIKLQIS